MSILNALSVFAGGATQGYRAREETNRQIAEVKRKALLEEREQRIREDAQRTQDALAQQQIAESQTDVAGKKAKLQREATPFTGDLGLGDLRKRLGIPDLNYGHITDLQQVLAAMEREQGNREELQFRASHPEAFGGSHKPYLSAEDQALLDLAEKKRQFLTSRLDPMLFAADPQKYSPFLQDVYSQTEADLPYSLRKLLQANRDSVAADSARVNAARNAAKKNRVMPSAKGR